MRVVEFGISCLTDVYTSSFRHHHHHRKQASSIAMPAPPPLTHALLSSPLPSRPYILDIHRYPGTSTDHLLLRHPSPEISIADAQTLQLVNTLKGGHVGNVTGISVDHEQQGAVWSAGKDARVIRWDERGRGVGMRIDGKLRTSGVACSFVWKQGG